MLWTRLLDLTELHEAKYHGSDPHHRKAMRFILTSGLIAPKSPVYGIF